jgi:phospholipid transport system substrate-binding protein
VSYLKEGAGPRPARRVVLAGLASVILGSGLGGLSSGGLAPAFAQVSQASEARKPIIDLYNGLQAVMRMSGASFQQRFERLAPVIDRVFDLETILRTSVGLVWNQLAEQQRQALFTIFRTYTSATYTANFDKDDGEKFEVLPQTRLSGNDQIVQTRLIGSSGEPTRIDYVMRSGAMGWRIVDVLLDGTISRVAVQRSDFRSLLRSGEPTPLIDSLRRKVADLSGGAIRP